MATLTMLFHAAAADVVPSLTVTENLTRSIGQEGKGRNATYFQAGSWRTNFTIVLPITEGETLDNLVADDEISIAVGDYSFDGTFADATIDRTKRKAVFKLTDADDELAPVGTITLTWNADSVKIIGALKAADPDAILVYAEGSAEKGKIKDILGASVTISAAPDGGNSRVEKEWQDIKVTGTENFREQNKKGDTFIVGSHQITATADDVRPTVKITNPRADVRKEGPFELTFEGSAKDNVEVFSVLVRVDDEEYEEAFFEQGNKVNAGTWTFDLPELEPGPHHVEVVAVDHDGLYSKPESRLITVVKTAALTVLKQGDGNVALSRINPVTNRKEPVKNFALNSPITLEVGQTYVLDALETTAGQVFGSWSGDVDEAEAAGPSFTFQLPDLETVTLTASFVTNPYPAFAGNYVLQFGLGEDAVSLDSIGQLELSVSADKGAISGKVFLGNSATGVPFLGRLNADGSFFAEVTVPGKPWKLGIDLTIDLESGAEVFGTVSAYEDDPEDPLFASGIVGARTGAGGGAVPAALVGTYNVLIETPDAVDAREVTLPPGYFTATVSAAGNVTGVGVMTNGAPFTFGGAVNQSGVTLVRVPVPGGVITGTLALKEEDPGGASVEVALYWNSEVLDLETGEVNFEQVEIEALGEKFVPASSLTGLFAGSSGEGALTITFYEADETGMVTEEDIVRDFVVGTTNAVTLVGEPSAEAVALQINPADGKVTGQFKHPVSGHVVTFNGLALPGELRAAGQYRDGTDSGPIVIELVQAM